MIRLSVIITTHNPRERIFQRVLDALRQQTLAGICARKSWASSTPGCR
jgi:hypothetical protein